MKLQNILFAFVLCFSLLLTSCNNGDVFINSIDLGNPESESAHNLSASFADIVEYSYPEYWIMSVRASGYDDGFEPYYTIDGNEDTYWQVTGKPQHPMVRGNWIEIELNQSKKIDEISIDWFGEEPYEFKIYEKPFSDFRSLKYTNISEPKIHGLETYKLDNKLHTRAIRIEFAVCADNNPQGIRQIRVGGLKYPDAYPQAVHHYAPIISFERIYYVEFERILNWQTFTLRRPYADGGSGRRIMPRNDAFEGGWIDFDITVNPKEQNFITLELWESNKQLMLEHGNAVMLQVLEGSVQDKARWFLPEKITEQKKLNIEWYGLKPQPGRFVYATYRLPKEFTEGKTRTRLRLKGIGNIRRDYPMREPSPPIYNVYSHTSVYWMAK